MRTYSYNRRIKGYIPESKSLNQKLQELDLEELNDIKDIDTRFKRLIIKFVNFLRNEDFIISTDALIKFFSLYEEFDVFELDDMKYTLKMLLCKTREQYVVFENYFEMFFYGAIDLKNEQAYEGLKQSLVEAKISDLMKEKEEKEAQFKKFQQTLEIQKQEVIKEFREERQKVEQEKNKFIENAFSSGVKVSRRKSKNESVLKEWFEDNSNSIKEFLQNTELNEKEQNDAYVLLSLSDNEILNVISKEEDKSIDNLKKILNTVMLENLIDGNDPSISGLCLLSSNILMKSKSSLDKRFKEITDEIERFDNDIRKEEDKVRKFESVISKEIETKREEIKSYEGKIDSISKIVEKEMVQHHRPLFLEGKNSVKVETNLDLLNSDIENLTDDKYSALTDIIQANASKFRTKISRSMIKHKNKKFNYKRTMQNSLKTFGVPIELYYEKPKVKKTKIVCILDVSGSCVKSSKLLLRFIYELSEVFKGGVKSYAFIKGLTDISDFFVNYHIDDAIEYSLMSVARTYSDYYTALKTFNDYYLGEVDKNTIVIFLGDARNNRNDPGVEYLSAIRKRAKSTIWLNVEEKPKWNVNDSIIGLYSEYMDDVYEILTTNHIIKFLEGFRIE